MSAADSTEHDPDALRHAHEALRRFSAEAVTRDTTTGDTGLEAGAAPVVQPTPGRPLGEGDRYGPRGLLGRGGGGEVWEVDDLVLGRAVAVKVQLATGVPSDERLARFIGEAATTATLEHPGILPVYDLGRTADGRLWFSMRRAGGTTLSDAIAGLVAGGPSSLTALADRVQVLVQVCEAVAYAHSRGVIHRDLKPGNIMLGSYGEVLVLDWGTAVRSGTVGRAVGTPMYMAPEQARGERIDERTDVYGLGATLWHLVTLQPPLDGNCEPERFWDDKRAGRLSPLPPEVERQLPDDLLAILRSALHLDPQRRPAGAAAFRDELRGWLRGREAATLREAAERRLRDLCSRGDHRGFAQVEDELERAAGLAPGDPRITAARKAARAAHARFAIDRDELDLASELADPGDADLQRLLSGARRRHRLRQGWQIAILAAALLALGLAGWQVWSDHRARFGVWQLVWERDFAAPGASTAGLRGDLGGVRVDGDGMHLDGVELLTLDGVAETGDVRVRATVRWPHQVDGFELHVGVNDVLVSASPYVRPIGIGCQFGGWLGARSIVGVARALGDSTLDASGWYDHLLDPERDYAVEMVRQGALVRLRLDGRIVLEHEVLMPPQGDDCRRVGVRAWGPVIIRQLSVERLGVPRRSGPLAVGEAFLAADQTPRATQAFLRVANDLPGDPLGEQALALAINAACRDRTSSEPARTALLQRLIEAAPTSPYRREAEEMLILRDWLDGRTDAALGAAEILVGRDPASTVAQRMASQMPEWLSPAWLARLLALVRQAQGVQELILRRQSITDLSPLAGLPLRELSLEETPVSDLGPLRGMPLRVLHLAGSQVTDLSPLAGLPIIDLTLSNTPVRDISVLASLPLRRLVLNNTAATDLSPLTGMRLVMLNINDLAVDRLPPCDYGCMLMLNIQRTGISDLSPLAGSPLGHFDAGGSQVVNLAPLATCRQLRRLMLPQTPVADLAPLAGLLLTHVRLGGSQVANLAPLRGMALQEIDVGATSVTDLAPLAGMPLRTVVLNGLSIADLSPLAGGTLETVRLIGGRVRDLGPLAQPTLQVLELGVTDADPMPMRACSRLRLLSGRPTAVSRPAWVALAEAWRAEGRDALARSLEVQVAFTDHDAEVLRRWAQPLGNRLYLWVPGSFSATEAPGLAAAVGARLLTIPDAATESRLLAWGGVAETCWLGLTRVTPGGWTWDDGSPATWHRAYDARLPSARAGWYSHTSKSMWPAFPGGDAHQSMSVTLEWSLTAPR